MPSDRGALSWGIGLSLALHGALLGSAPEPHPYVKRAPPAQIMELALIRLPAPQTQRPSTPIPASSEQAPTPAAQSAASPVAAEPKLPRRRAPRAVDTEAQRVPPLPAADNAGHDLSALERTLKRIAATSELSPDQRRKAMLVVLRTWEDPARGESAEQLIDALLRELHPGQDR